MNLNFFKMLNVNFIEKRVLYILYNLNNVVVIFKILDLSNIFCIMGNFILLYIYMVLNLLYIVYCCKY